MNAPQRGHGRHRGREREGRRSERGEQPMVPAAEFRSYYGRPVLKAPVWKHDIPAYLFTGGLAAASSLLAAGGDLTGRPGLRRSGRLTALGALAASTYFLVNDLGRPARALNMLRVARPTSPMSMGSWILAAYGPAAGVAALSELARGLPSRGLLRTGRRVAPAAGRGAGLAAAAVAPALASYTAVLLADTAVPAWHEAYPQLPFLFTGSALASGAGAALVLAPPAEQGPARRLALLGAAVELAATHRVETRLGLVSAAYRQPAAKRLLDASKVLNAVGAAGVVLGRRSRAVSALAGLALLAASAATRFGIYAAGVASAKDPAYTIRPQRSRLDETAPVAAAG